MDPLLAGKEPDIADATYYGEDDTVVERITTGRRFLFTLLFWIIARLVVVVIGFVVLFELCYTLITKRPPSPRVVRFGHRLVRYEYDLGQFVTYNQEELPFPFDDFPHETEPLNA